MAPGEREGVAKSTLLLGGEEGGGVTNFFGEGGEVQIGWCR